MSERKTLGQILHQYGRIRHRDQELALEYQRRHGGYFGEALVSLGVISPEELEFGLAAQFDLPYVFPDPETIDLDAARLVAPDWALAHLMLPIARTDEALSVLSDSPIKPEAVAELEVRTGMAVYLAIASPARIRELILHVFADSAADDEDPLPRVADAGDFLDRAIASDATRLGVSVRGREVVGWWESEGRVHRLRLLSGWPGSVEGRILPPSPAPDSGSPDKPWEARLRWGGTELPARVHRIILPRGEEMVVELPRPGGASPEHPPPPPEMRAEVRLLMSAGVGRFLVTSEPTELGLGILPHLPRLFFGSVARSVHLSIGDPLLASGDPLPLPEGVEERSDLLVGLKRFRLDGLTVLVAQGRSVPAEEVAGIAGALFLSAPAAATEPGSDARAALLRAGVGWEIQIRSAGPGEVLSWRLHPLHERRSAAPPPPAAGPTPNHAPSPPSTSG